MIHYKYTIGNETIIVQDKSLIPAEVEFTEVEIKEFTMGSQVTEKVKVAQFRLALIDFNIMPSFVLSIINQIEDEVEREKLITLFEYSEFMERYNPTLVYMAKNTFGMTDEQLDKLFILANTK